MPDANRSLPELVLALFAGRERTAAIYGDLLELAATRPRTSFWTGYFRTLMSLSWRPLTAFLTGASFFAILSYNLVFPILFFFAMGHPHFGEAFGDATLQLWFLVPFAVIRFGIRDRAVQLAFAVSLISTGVLFLDLFYPVLFPEGTSERYIGFVLLAPICFAILSPWRRFLIPVAASCAAGSAVAECFYRLSGLDWAIPGLQQLFPVVPTLFDALVVAIVFSWIHRLQRHAQIAGGVHA